MAQKNKAAPARTFFVFNDSCRRSCFGLTTVSLLSQISIFYFAASCFAVFGLPDYIASPVYKIEKEYLKWDNPIDFTRDTFDYTEWQRKLWEGKSIEEIHTLATKATTRSTFGYYHLL